MNKSELSRICGLSRQMIYNLLNKGMSEEEILTKYTKLSESDMLELNHDYVLGFKNGYNQHKLETKYNPFENKYNSCIKELTLINELIRDFVNEYHKRDEINFKYIDKIYEIVKDYRKEVKHD